MKKSTLGFIAITFLFCVILFVVEQFAQINYGIKIALKIVLFGTLFILFNQKRKVFSWIGYQRFFKSIGYGALFGGIILAAYYLIGFLVDFQSISLELQSKLSISAANFILVALYITLVNSLIEELFFRGLIFSKLKNESGKFFAYTYSALLFAGYHIGIFLTWFTLPVSFLALFALVSAGLLFAWMNREGESIFPSWIAHAFADAAIMYIGLIMFGIL